MMAVDSGPEGERRVLKGWHVLAVFLFFFGMIFSVNGLFLYKALSTHTGVVSVEPYRKGLAYNERIAADEAQRVLGWREETQLDASGGVRVRLMRDEGDPVRGLRLTAVISRPATQGMDQTLAMVEGEGGVYSGQGRGIEAGTWVVAVEAHGSDGRDAPLYRARRRIWVKP